MTDYEHSLGYLVKKTQQALRHAMDRALAAVGLTTPQYAALSALSSETALSNAELARRCFVTPQTMHQMIGGLEARGLTQRSRHPEHGRIVEVGITETGTELLEEAHRRVSAVEAKMAQDITAAEKEQVTGVLRRCCLALEDRERTERRKLDAVTGS